jgi:mono/diheme cytochrome c family protein
MVSLVNVAKAGALAGVVLVSVMAVAGCGSQSAQEAGQAPISADASAVDPSLVASAKATIAANGCMNCHMIGGQGGGRAPDLSRVGSYRDAPWIVAHINDPRAHNPRSQMPSFKDKISGNDLETLGAYLASLK